METAESKPTRQYQTRVMEAAPVEPEETERPDGDDPFAGISFASPAARTAAEAAGLTASAFANRTPTGHNGRFTTPDVHEIVKDWA